MISFHSAYLECEGGSFIPRLHCKPSMKKQIHIVNPGRGLPNLLQFFFFFAGVLLNKFTEMGRNQESVVAIAVSTGKTAELEKRREGMWRKSSREREGEAEGEREGGEEGRSWERGSGLLRSSG